MSRVSPSARWQALRGILAVGHLRRMYAVVGLWAATDLAFFLAVSVVAYGDGGPGAVGLVGAARVLPGALCLGFVAVVADRVSRPLLVAAVNAAFVAISLVMAATVAAGGSLVVLVLLQVAASVAAALLHPSLHGLLPRLVPLPSQLIQAGAVWSLVTGIGAVLGPGIGGWLLARGGPDVLFLALAVVYAVTAGIAGSIRTTYQPAREPSRALRRSAWWWSPLRGIGLFAAPGARTMLALSLVQRALGGFVGAFLVLYAFEVFGADGQARSGTLLAAVGVGGLVGSTITLGVVGRHTRWWFAAGLLLSGLPLVVLGATTEVGPAMLALGVCGAGAAWALIYGSSLVTRLLPDHVAGRGWGALLGLGAGATALGSLAAPLLARLLGLPEPCSSPGCSRPSPSWSASRGCVPWPVAPSRGPRTSPCSAAWACSRPCQGSASSASPWQRGVGRSSRVRWSSTRASRARSSSWWPTASSSSVSRAARYAASAAATRSARWPCCGTCRAPPPWSPPARACC